MRHIFEYQLDPLTAKKKTTMCMTFGAKTFIEKYERLEKIIDGTHSVIWLVRNKKTKVKYICKILPTIRLRKEEFIIPNLIDSPRIAKVLEIHQAYIRGINRTYMIMEYTEGVVDMFDYVNYGVIPTENNVRSVFYKMCLCIQDVHNAGYCHGDIKIENFIVTSNNPTTVKIIDFGFSFLDDKIGLSFFGGTRNYIAPEVVKEHNGSRASDIWSIGSVLCYVIGNFYYKPGTDFSKTRFSNELVTLLEMCLKVDPLERSNIQQILDSDWFNKF